MNSSKKIGVFFVLASACVLAACSGLTKSDNPVVTTWWLKPYTGMTQPTVPGAVLPVKLTVTAVPGLDSDQILTLSGEAELRSYAGARWADHTPELFASLIGRSLEASGRFDVQPARTGSGSGGCFLQLEVREFFADLGAGGSTTAVRVALNGRFQCEPGVPVFVQSSATMTVGDERMSVIVATFQQAMDRVMRDMLDKI
ncbi:MAG: ABC-type transport auxiliary lipoprotein family protein [Lysobacterales bacterium]